MAKKSLIEGSTMSKKKKKPWVVFIAIILAIIIGNWVGTDKAIFGITYYSIFNLIGTLFIRALTLIVVPLVSSSIITGIARIAGDPSFGRLGAKTFGFYVTTSLMAILIGLFFVNVIGPGFQQTVQTMSAASFEQNLTGKEGNLLSILYDIIPSNIVEVFSGKMLGLIFFSLIFGYAISKIEAHPSSILIGFWQGIFQAMLKFTHIVMLFLPLGVFCLVAKVFATTGIESLKSVSLFFVTVLCGFIVFVFIGLPLLLKYVGGVNPIRHFRAMAPALVTAFSTSSSSATLPVTMECVEKRAGVSNRLTSLVIPLGTSINLSGSALYECVAALFVAQAYGIEISLVTQFLVVVLSLLTSMGVAGIPSGSLVAIIVILKALGLPAEGIGLFLAVDRLLDMARTTVNVFSDSVCAVLVARSEGEKVLTHPDAEI
jgi:proton glutamate symport protein